MNEENRDKAYKLVAVQEGISNKSAKDLIDKGLVYSAGKKIRIARALMHTKSKFRVTHTQKPKIIFEDDNIMAINKPFYEVSENIAKIFKCELIHRLDKGTSGVILLSKSDTFKDMIIHEFRQQNVYKEYVAVVNGIFVDDMTIDEPILTIKNKYTAISKLSEEGKSAVSHVSPVYVENKKSKLKVVIETGRTHQIRIHLKSVGYPIIGDELYGGRSNKRMLLHAKRITFLDYDIKCDEDKDFDIL